MRCFMRCFMRFFSVFTSGAIAATAIGMLLGAVAHAQSAKPAPTAKPALTVKWVQASLQAMPSKLPANGTIAPWAEAVVSAEVGGYRLSQVRAQVGDRVQKGQVLASFSTDTARVDLDIAKAQLAEAQASAADTAANAGRARAIEREGFYSAAQLSSIFSQEKAAAARVQAAKARLAAAERALRETEVKAPDDGVVSSRTAVLGAVVPQGAELFRLIRQGRLEWRAELTSTELVSIKPGMKVSFMQEGGVQSAGLQGTVRMISPTVDPASRTAIAFVDLPATQAARAGLRAGSFARGEFELQRAEPRLSVPQSAVVLRDGFSYVFALGAISASQQSKVTQVKVQTGARASIGGIDWVAVTAGLAADAKIVASGAAFLADGDTVKVSQP